jgi:hypothetical protein
MFGRVKLHACMTIAGSNIFVSENPKFWGQSFVRSLLIFFLIINFLRLSALCNALKCSVSEARKFSGNRVTNDNH